MDENPDWDYRQAEKQAFIDAALQVGEASFGGWLTGSFMGGGYSKIQSIADRFRKSRQAYNQYVQSQQKLETQDRGRFSVLTKHRDMVYWSRVMEYA